MSCSPEANSSPSTCSQAESDPCTDGDCRAGVHNKGFCLSLNAVLPRKERNKKQLSAQGRAVLGRPPLPRQTFLGSDLEICRESELDFVLEMSVRHVKCLAGLFLSPPHCRTLAPLTRCVLTLRVTAETGSEDVWEPRSVQRPCREDPFFLKFEGRVPKGRSALRNQIQLRLGDVCTKASHSWGGGALPRGPRKGLFGELRCPGPPVLARPT